MAKPLILVTGANGYIAGKLIPRLLDAGYPVRCMVRDPQKIYHQPWVRLVEVVTADVSDPVTLGAALHQVDTAYYLVHNMAKGTGYTQVEVDSANHFAQAAAQAGTQHLIYLGGLADPQAKIAPHMRSRIETGEVLRKNPVPVTEFRAGVIVGPGSISFEMIRYLCEVFPILVGPSWLKNRTQPISVDNVIDYLMAALEKPAGRGQVFEIGGQEVYTYAETMLIYAQCRGLKRRMVIVPTLPTVLMAYFVDKLTPVPKGIAYPLIEGLNSHSTVTDPKALEVFPEIVLTEYRDAIRQSLDQLHPTQIEPIWNGMHQPQISLKREGFLINHQQAHFDRSVGEMYPALVEWTAKNFNGFEAEIIAENSKCLFRDPTSNHSARWIEWELLPQGDTQTLLRQTSYVAPKGLAGFLSGQRWKIRQHRLFRRVREILG